MGSPESPRSKPGPRSRDARGAWELVRELETDDDFCSDRLVCRGDLRLNSSRFVETHRGQIHATARSLLDASLADRNNSTQLAAGGLRQALGFPLSNPD